MVVKRIASRSAKKRAVKKPSKPGASMLRGAAPPLPTAPKAPVVDPLAYVLLLYGREKIGKTVWLSSFPDALFLSTEPGTKGLQIYEYNAEAGGCKTWELALAAAKQLEQTDRFRTVIFDTADRAYELCMDYVCRQMGIEHPGVAPDGKEDYGKSWKAVKKEFSSLIHRIIQTGRGVAFTSHAKEETFTGRSGDKFTRIHPSMSGQARGVVEAIVDLFFYCEYMRAPDGGTKRVIITTGDEIVWAGHRKIVNAAGQAVNLPRLIPMTEEGGYAIYKAAFAGERVGLNPETLLPAKTASPAIREFYRGVRRNGDPAVAPAKKRKTPRRR